MTSGVIWWRHRKSFSAKCPQRAVVFPLVGLRCFKKAGVNRVRNIPHHYGWKSLLNLKGILQVSYTPFSYKEKNHKYRVHSRHLSQAVLNCIIFIYFPVWEIALQTNGFHHLHLLPPKIKNTEHFWSCRYSGIHITFSLAPSKFLFN